MSLLRTPQPFYPSGSMTTDYDFFILNEICKQKLNSINQQDWVNIIVVSPHKKKLSSLCPFYSSPFFAWGKCDATS